jgi:hypothetical protein
MRAHCGTHLFHLVKRSLQVIGRDGANYSGAFVALDIRLLSSDDAFETAATVGCPEIVMR